MRPDRPRDLHLTGVVELLVARDPSAVSAALTKLRAAWAEQPEPAIGNDLAAAHLVLAELTGDPRSRLAAARLLSSVEKAYPAATYNLGIAFEGLSLDNRAAAAWTRLATTEDGAWSRRAKARAAVLDAARHADGWQQSRRRILRFGGAAAEELRTACRRFPVQIRDLVQDELVPAWGEGWEAGDSGRADAALAQATVLSTALRAAGGDAGPDEAVQHVRRARRHEDLRRLAVGHRLYGQARAFHEDSAYAAAAPLFADAERELSEAASPAASWALFYSAVGDYQRGEYPRALSRLRRLGSAGVLLGYVDWMVSLIRSRQGRHEEVLEPARAARRAFMAAGERENVVQMDLQLAATLHRLGRRPEAWQRFGEALAHRRHLVSSRREQTLLAQVGRFLLHEGDGRGAVLFLEEWVAEAERSGRALERALAQADLASALRAVGRSEEALAVLAAAGAAAASIDDPSAQRDVRADLGIAEADLFAEVDPGRSLAALARAESFVAATRARLHLVRIARRRARLLEAVDPVAAGAAYETALREVERQRDLLLDPVRRLEYLEVATDLVDEVVSFDLDRGRKAAAFDHQESMRAHSLRQFREHRGLQSQRRRIGEIRGELPRNTCLLAYWILPERTVVSVVGDRHFRVLTVGVGEEQLNRTARRWIGSLRSAQGGEDLAAARWLGKHLIPSAVIEGCTKLVVVPHGVLHALPFAALELSDGERLVHRAAVTVVPSANLFLDLGERRLPQRDRLRWLLVGDFAHSSRHYPQLAEARWAALEARRAIAGLEVLAGPAATVSAFLTTFPRHPVVIFTGHGIAAASSADAAGLLLAPEDDHDDGFLSGDEVAELEEPVSTRLVVLASCGSGAGWTAAGEGPLSMARPFFGLGVPSVVATLWETRERDAGRFVGELLGGGAMPTAQTLREVQLRWLERGEPPGSWAVFQWMGSVEPDRSQILNTHGKEET